MSMPEGCVVPIEEFSERELEEYRERARVRLEETLNEYYRQNPQYLTMIEEVSPEEKEKYLLSHSKEKKPPRRIAADT